MRIRTYTAAVAIATALPLMAACGTSAGQTTADPAACKATMRDAFDEAESNPDAPEVTETPAPCRGLSEKKIKKYAADIIEDEMKEGINDAFDDEAGDTGADTELKVGETFKYSDGMKITVDRIEKFSNFHEYDSLPEKDQTPFRVHVKVENGSKKPVDLDNVSVLASGAENGGESEFTIWENGSKEMTGRLAAGVTATKTSDAVLDKKYGTKLLVTVERMDDETLLEAPNWTGPIR